MARKYTPFNGMGGESFVTDDERIAHSDAARQAAMQALQGGQQMGGFAMPQGPSENDLRNRVINQREQQERLMMTGGDQERQNIAARDVGMNYRQDVQSKAGIMGAEDERAQMNEGKPLRDLMSQRVLEGFQGGAGTMSDAQMDQMALLGAIANKQQLPNLRGQRRQDEMAGLQMEQFKRQQGMDRIQQTLDAGDEAAAMALGQQLGLPVPKAKIGDPATAMAELQQAVAQFGADDAATFGWDPNNQDVDRLDAMAENAVRILVQSRIPEQEARRQVNMAIQQAVAQSGKSMGTGWIDTLLQRRGLASGGGPSQQSGGLSLGGVGRMLSGG